jgi:predicted transposase YbfD/YdcC
MALCGVIAGCDGWQAIEDHAHDRKEWFLKFLELKHGVPSHDTFERLFERMCPEEFQRLLLEVAKELHEMLSGKNISIDGKTIRGSYDKALDQGQLHVLSAYVGECGVTLAQIATDVKSNEITAIPGLIDLIDIQGAVVTLDAMGCQTKIADKIIRGGGDYVIGLKGNQGTLRDSVENFFSNNTMENLEKSDHASVLYHVEKGHGRIEERAYVIIDDVEWLENLKSWNGLKTIGMVISRRTINDKTSEERRYFIGSIEADVLLFEQAVRGHWSIENSSHYILDVSFNEDKSSIRRDNAPENMAVLRRVANGLLTNEKSTKLSVKGKIRKANRSTDYLEMILGIGIS